MSPSKSAQDDPGREPAGWADAIAELEALVNELDSQSVDVDVLSQKVRRASFLVEWCRQRIDAAELAIEELGVDSAD